MDYMEEGSALDSYLEAIKKIPRLSKEKEYELAVKYFQDDDLKAAKILIESNLKFVAYVARQYTNYKLSIMDLIQEGNIALMKALKKFNPFMGVRFVSFAVADIRAAMLEFILSNATGFKISSKQQKKVYFNINRLRMSTGGFISQKEIEHVAKELNIKEDVVYRTFQKMYSMNSLENDNEGIKYANYKGTAILNNQGDTLEYLIIEEKQKQKEFDIQSLYRAIEKLNPRYEDIIKRRWLSNKEIKDIPTFQDLATEQGCTLQRIDQIEKKALKQLKVLMA